MEIVSGLTAAEKETLLLMADNGMNVSRAADEIHYSRKTIYDRLRNVKAKTGIDPTDFWGLHRLLTLIEMEKEERDADKG